MLHAQPKQPFIVRFGNLRFFLSVSTYFFDTYLVCSHLPAANAVWAVILTHLQADRVGRTLLIHCNRGLSNSGGVLAHILFCRYVQS